MKNRVRYYKLSAKTTRHEAQLEVQAEEIVRPLRGALSKVKSMDELNELIKSDAYINEMNKYQSLLKKRIEYHEQQMSQLTSLRGSLTTLELGIEAKLRKMLLADYTKILDSAKQNQF